MQSLTFVTSNKGKAREAQEILKFPLRIHPLDLVEIQSMKLEEIVEHKVKQAYDILKTPVIVDDVGFLVDAWGGFPGPFIKFMTPKGSNDLLLQMMSHEKNRKVTLMSGIGYTDGIVTRVFIGEVNGNITISPRGKDGWGFDPILIPEGYNQTYAQMGPEVKNTMSHRKRSLEKLREFLSEEK